MIGVIASFVVGMITKNYSLLLAPALIPISRKSRDWGMLAYFVFVLYAAQEFVALDVYSYSDLVTSIAVTVSLVLLLEDVLTPKISPDRLELLSTLPVLAGIILSEALIAGGIFYLAVKLKPRYKIALAATIPAVAFFFLKTQLSQSGSTGSQVLVLGGFVILTASVTVMRRNLKRVQMF